MRRRRPSARAGWNAGGWWGLASCSREDRITAPGQKCNSPSPASMLAVARKLPIWFINRRSGKRDPQQQQLHPVFLRKKGERRVTGHAGCTWTPGAPATALALAYCGGGEKSLRGFCLPSWLGLSQGFSNIRCQGMKSDHLCICTVFQQIRCGDGK